MSYIWRCTSALSPLFKVCLQKEKKVAWAAANSEIIVLDVHDSIHKYYTGQSSIESGLVKFLMSTSLQFFVSVLGQCRQAGYQSVGCSIVQFEGWLDG
jgi:hypothetical protein